MNNNLISNSAYTPSFSEIDNYIKGETHILWQDFISYIEENYKASPKVAYSKCSAKPGWNVKYQKSSKSICTIYPDEHEFVVLVVLSLDLVNNIKPILDDFEPTIANMIKESKPFNGTLWLMINVVNKDVLSNIKQLLAIKRGIK